MHHDYTRWGTVVRAAVTIGVEPDKLSNIEQYARMQQAYRASSILLCAAVAAVVHQLH